MDAPIPPIDAATPWLRLALVPGVTPAMQRGLLEAFGTPLGALGQTLAALAEIIGPGPAEALLRGPAPAQLARALRWLELPGHHVLGVQDPSYPAALRAIHDPPTMLYACGDPAVLSRNMIAIVGSRNATPQGRQDAYRFARGLSEAGLGIASGLALGIDGAAHRGGLDGEGSTVAVLGTGADRVYPPAHRPLAAEIVQRGCIVSEYPLGTPPVPENFPRRNRLISGLALGVLVVEAAHGSGSMITARLANEEGREVFAIPGSIHSTLSKGCHGLIKQGAQLVEDIADILGALRPGAAAPVAAAPREPAPAEHHDPVLELMGYAPVSMDQIAERSGIGIASIAVRLSRLQLEGRIAGIPGGLFQRIGRA